MAEYYSYKDFDTDEEALNTQLSAEEQEQPTKKSTPRKLSESRQKKLIAQFREWHESWDRYWSKNNRKFTKLSKFVNGDQWDVNVVDLYRRENRPCVTINKIYPVLQQVIGEYNLNEAEISLRKIGVPEINDEQRLASSVTDKVLPDQQQQQEVSNIQNLIKSAPLFPTDPKVKITEGLTRQLGFNQDSQEVYRNGGEAALKGGFGAWRIITCYDDEKRLFQTLKISPIVDPTVCFWDIEAKSVNKTDGHYAGMTTTMTMKHFRKKYPKAKSTNWDASYDSSGNFLWKSQDLITIGEIYVKEYYGDTEAIIAGEKKIIYQSNYDSPEEFEAAIAQETQQGKRVLTSKIKNSKIMHYKFTSKEILEYTKTPFKELPLPFVDGASTWDGYEQKCHAFAENAVKPQEELNTVASEISLWVLLAKKSQIMVPTEVLPPELRQIWQNSSGNPPVFLPYSGSEAIKLGGLKPEPLVAPIIPQELMQQYQRLEKDIMDCMGRFEANLGQEGNDTSGKHLAYRAIQGAGPADVYRYNLKKAMETTGRIIVESLPNIYDEERAVTIENRDGSFEEVVINKREFDFANMKWAYNIDMSSIGRWDISIDVSPSVAVLNQMERNLILQMMGLDPSGQTYALLAPIFAKTIKTPHSKEMEARLQFLVPPQILAAEQGKQFNPPPSPQDEAMQQMAQLQQAKLQSEIQKNEMQAQNQKLDSMAKQLNAIAALIMAQATEQETEIKKEIAEDSLSHSIISGEREIRHKEKVLEYEMLKNMSQATQMEQQKQMQQQMQEQALQQQAPAGPV